MDNLKRFSIAVMPGDGIGPEVTTPCLDLLRQVCEGASGFALDFETLEAGAELYARSGEAFPREALEAARKADAILLGAMGLPSVRYPDGREIAP
ncbi:MAG: isocitrate/isopropylmalate family dehydrogenase, partial [Kiloniellales bacterium]|nr:isocitrate/isopropylmalate family dehydrogenase [Kiloniellales bacterium]